MKNRTKSYFCVAKPALKYKWTYIIILLISIILVFADLAFAQISRVLFNIAPNIPQKTLLSKYWEKQFSF